MRIGRALAKTISYRILGTITSYIIAFFITGSIKIGVTVAIADLVSKMAIYFLHELVWDKIPTK